MTALDSWSGLARRPVTAAGGQADNNRQDGGGMECSSHRNNDIRIFKGGCHKLECVEFMDNHNFEIYDCNDYEYITHNLTQMSDIVFKNRKI